MGKYKNFIPRSFAVLIDTVIIWLTFDVFESLFLTSETPNSIAFTVLIITFIFSNFYNIYLHKTYGQTLGKMIMRIKVVSLSETPLTFYQAFLRRIIDLSFELISTFAQINFILLNGLDTNNYRGSLAAQIIGGAALLYLVSEIIVTLYNKEQRSMHDYIAGTVVVKTVSKEV